MPQSLVQIYAHLVFSTKSRKPFLHDRAIRERAHAYLQGICENQGCPSLRIGGVEDHVHILCRLSKTQDEFRRLCLKYRIEIDERYVWD